MMHVYTEETAEPTQACRLRSIQKRWRAGLYSVDFSVQYIFLTSGLTDIAQQPLPVLILSFHNHV
jgi:hypothetical protein